jgi:decaprenyl-phosphate phosphoribosyltransferase
MPSSIPSTSALAFALVKLMRPHQWLKNVFVFAGLVFSQSWRDGPMVQRVLLTFAAFCCVSSTVYILNDWHDRAADALHPTKRHRALASGIVSLPLALVLAGVLLLAGFALALQVHSRALLLLLGMYVLLNLAYSWWLKRVPVVDVSIIASGFMLRLLAGTYAVGITPSRWLLLTGLFLALFLGFSKRKAESFHAGASQRAVMAHYPAPLLDAFVAVTLTATLVTYSFYATSPGVQLQHGAGLIYTVPVVIFGMLRYAYQVGQSRGARGEDVARDLFRDPYLVAAGLCWAGLFASSWLR